MKNRRAYIRRVLKNTLKKFRLDYDVTVVFQAEPEDGEERIPQYLRAEESVITCIERAMAGEASWKRMNAYMEKQDVNNCAGVDVDDSHYNKVKFYFYDDLLNIKDENMFMMISKSSILHEVLHVVMCPLAQYCQSLETKG